MDREILRVERLSVCYRYGERDLQAVRGVSFGIEEGEIVGLAGESGCGKSTVARSLLRLLPAGSVVSADALRFEDEDLMSVSDRDYCTLRGRCMTLVSQNAATAFDPLRTIGSQMREVLKRNGVNRGDLDAVIYDVMTRLCFRDPKRVLHQRPHQCSGGMLQRLLLGMVIACHPRLMIADEPTSALDVTLQAQTLRLLRQLREDDRLSILFITHDLNVASAICDRLMIMYGGLVVEAGPTERMLSHPTHPYTRALLRAAPSSDEAGIQGLTPIVGTPPSLANLPRGCPFAPRCPQRLDVCDRLIPMPRRIGEGCECRCHLLESDNDS